MAGAILEAEQYLANYQQEQVQEQEVLRALTLQKGEADEVNSFGDVSEAYLFNLPTQIDHLLSCILCVYLPIGQFIRIYSRV